jgi:glutamate synthase (NADPH) large chain
MAGNYPHPDLPIPTKQGLYDPAYDHDACGVGLVANIKGAKSHSIIEQGLEVLVNLGHRGACGADPLTGDGAGILIQMPHEFFVRECASLDVELPHAGHYGVGMTFLPQHPNQRHRCQNIIQEMTASEGMEFLGWRDVPVNPDAIGVLAAQVRPVIRQFFVGRPKEMADDDHYEANL